MSLPGLVKQECRPRLRQGSRPKLAEQSSEIAEDPALGNLAILYPEEGCAGVPDILPRRATSKISPQCVPV